MYSCFIFAPLFIRLWWMWLTGFKTKHTKHLQGGPSGSGKPPVDLDLGCSTILTGQ